MMKKLEKPIFESKNHGPGGIPLLKSQNVNTWNTASGNESVSTP